MIATLFAALALSGSDSLPQITLAEALQRSTGLNPAYVQALGLVGEAEWGRRSAILA